MDWYWLGGVVLGFVAGVGVGVNLLTMIDEVMKKVFDGDCGGSLAALDPSPEERMAVSVRRQESASVRQRKEGDVRRQVAANIQQQEKGVEK